ITANLRDRLRAIPTINPELPRWQDDLNEAFEMGAPAIRLFPQHQGIPPDGDAMRVVIAAAAAAAVPVHLSVRLEDVRQRHPLDTAAELPAAAVRALVRSDDETRVIVANADASYIEEVHFGLTEAEAQRVLWDIGWIWGPPEDQLARLLGTLGHERFVFGTGMPLRVPDVAVARVELLDLTPSERAAILGENAARASGS
ncbi:MAG: amidohydrolase family protein, partial [Gemmatimonadales bacterium]